MNALKESHMSQPANGSKEFIVQCTYCDGSNHKCPDCKHFGDDLKVGIVIFREGMIKDATTNDPLPTKFGKGGMMKLIDDKLGRTSFVHLRDAKAYSI